MKTRSVVCTALCLALLSAATAHADLGERRQVLLNTRFVAIADYEYSMFDDGPLDDGHGIGIGLQYRASTLNNIRQLQLLGLMYWFARYSFVDYSDTDGYGLTSGVGGYRSFNNLMINNGLIHFLLGWNLYLRYMHINSFHKMESVQVDNGFQIVRVDQQVQYDDDSNVGFGFAIGPELDFKDSPIILRSRISVTKYADEFAGDTDIEAGISLGVGYKF